MKRVIDREKRSKALSKAKPLKNIRENPKSFMSCAKGSPSFT